MIDPTPEQIEAVAIACVDSHRDKYGMPRIESLDEVPNPGTWRREIRAALVDAAAGALLVAPALSVSEYRSQSGDADRNGGEDGPEHEWGSHPETVAADTAELIAEARSRAEHPGTGSNTAQCLRECADALDAAGNAPVQVDEAKLASLLQEHRPSQWRSFANDTIVYRCCKQDFGRLIGRPRKADRDPRELWEEHMANVIAEWWRGGGR